MNLQHHFLIAMPSFQDPQFKRTVIYICEHNAEGAMGLVINKPIDLLTVETVLKKLHIISSPRDAKNRLDAPVLAGGPLADDRGFILHSPQTGFSSSVRISADTMITTSKDVLKALGTPQQPENILVALGYAGWQQGQLEQELMDNVWLTTEADPTILFHTPMADRWHEAANKLGINIFNIASQAGHA